MFSTRLLLYYSLNQEVDTNCCGMDFAGGGWGNTLKYNNLRVLFNIALHAYSRTGLSGPAFFIQTVLLWFSKYKIT